MKKDAFKTLIQHKSQLPISWLPGELTKHPKPREGWKNCLSTEVEGGGAAATEGVVAPTGWFDDQIPQIGEV